MGNILSVQKVQKYYGNKASLTRALDVISFDVEQGEFPGYHGGFRQREDYAVELHFHH